MQIVIVPANAALALQVTAGQNNAFSYVVARWDQSARRYTQLLTGLAAINDPNPDVVAIGSGTANQGRIFLCRGYIFPYDQNSVGPFAVDFAVMANGARVGGVTATVNEPLTLNLILQITAGGA